MSDKSNEDESKGLLSTTPSHSEQYSRQNNIEIQSPLQQLSGGGTISHQTTQNRNNNIRSYGSTNYVDTDVSERASLLSPSSEGIKKYIKLIYIYI